MRRLILYSNQCMSTPEETSRMAILGHDCFKCISMFVYFVPIDVNHCCYIFVLYIFEDITGTLLFPLHVCDWLYFAKYVRRRVADLLSLPFPNIIPGVQTAPYPYTYCSCNLGPPTSAKPFPHGQPIVD